MVEAPAVILGGVETGRRTPRDEQGAVRAQPLLSGTEFRGAVLRHGVARVEVVHRGALHDPQNPRALGGGGRGEGEQAKTTEEDAGRRRRS